MAIELALESRTRKPVVIDAAKLARHTAVLAQSGSGKSFMLGRLVEELALKTKARIIIFDPNSDFLRLTDADEHVWEDERLKPWFSPSDTYEVFARSWKKVPISIASNRNLTNARKLVVDWGSLGVYESASIMNLDLERDSDLYWCLFLASTIASDSWDASRESFYDFDHFRAESDNVVSYLLTGSGNSSVGRNPLAKTLRQTIGAHVALRYKAEVDSLGEYQTWRSIGDGQVDVKTLVDGPDEVPRVLVIDLQSLGREEERIAISSRILAALWEKGRRELWEAIRDYDKPDTRVPTFIIIDEAHNLVPEQRGSPRIQKLAAQITRIAAEGRKYGLYLVVATQRPRKIDSNVLTECDNLFLMRMTNDSDMDYAEQAFGFLPEKAGEKTKSLKVGELLLEGAVGNNRETLHACPRRTVQGGKGIPETHWTTPES